MEKSTQTPIPSSLYQPDVELSVLSEIIGETAELTVYDAVMEDTVLSIEPEEIDIPDPDPIEPKPAKGRPSTSIRDASGTAAMPDDSGYVPASSGHLTRRGGVFNGPSGKETYYNLPMGGVIRIMRRLGYSEEEWPYWVREDGAKMLGDYIIVAAELNLRPRGTIVPTSLGDGIVCDTGTFALTNPYQLDLAVNW